MISQLQIDSH